MKTKFLVLVIWISLFTVSCDVEETVKPTVSEKELTVPKSTGFVVLKERDQNSPLILSKRRDLNRGIKTMSTNEPFYKYLGRSLKMEELPLTDYRNFGWKVIDMDRFVKDYPNCYFMDNIGTSDNYSFGYASFDRYVQKSSVTKKVKGGFSIDLKLFSIGAKKSMERTFSKTIINQNKRVFGELHYVYKGSRYKLKKTTNDMKRIKSYVLKSFTDDLYNIPSNEFMETYGHFILCDFIVGGKAVGLYSGLYESNAGSETKEKHMRTDINASYGKKIKRILTIMDTEELILGLEKAMPMGKKVLISLRT